MTTTDELKSTLAQAEQRLAELEGRSALYEHEADEVSGLRRAIPVLKARIVARESHRLTFKAFLAAHEAVLRAKLETGDLVRAGLYAGAALVIRPNATTVTVRLPSGNTDRLLYEHIHPVEWERMSDEWVEEHPEAADQLQREWFGANDAARAAVYGEATDARA